MKVKIVKPYYVIRPGASKRKIEGIVDIKKTRAEKLIKRGTAVRINKYKSKKTNKHNKSNKGNKISKIDKINKTNKTKISKPNSNNLKSEIIDYLDKEGISYNSSATKLELLKLIE